MHRIIARSKVARPARNSSPGSRGSREATAAVPHFPAKPPNLQAPLSWLPPRNRANFRPSSQGRNTRFYSLKSWERVWRMAVAMANSKKRRERWDSSNWMVTLGKERGFPRISTTLAEGHLQLPCHRHVLENAEKMWWAMHLCFVVSGLPPPLESRHPVFRCARPLQVQCALARPPVAR